jgi:glycerophosphoryl diester phosphodiesterase
MRTHDISHRTPSPTSRHARSRTVRGVVVAAVLATTTSTALALAPTTHADDSGRVTTATAKPVHPLVAKPIVIGHRGAPGYRPEHTQGSYELASELGADFVECDIVSTKDHVLVCRHENDITGTTDVADHPEFADLKTTKVVDGRSITGWFTEDFTWAQLQTLRAKERLPDVRPANTAYNGVWSVPSFDQYLDIIAAESKKLGRPIGVYPETKHPTYFDSIGLSLEEPMLRILKAHGLAHATKRVFLQSFEQSNLRELNHKTDLPLIQLMDSSGGPYDQTAAGHPVTYAQLATKKGLKSISRYADGVGPNKDLVIPRDANGFLTQPTDLVRNAHRDKMLVHIFTMRNENQFMAKDFWIGTDPNAHGDAIAEDKTFLDAGIDGFFTDYADTGVAARDQWLAEN